MKRHTETQLPQLVGVVLPTRNGVTIRKRCNSLEMAKRAAKTRACSRSKHRYLFTKLRDLG